MSPLRATLLLTALIASGWAGQGLSQGAATCGTPFRFTAERVTLPLTVVNEFLFVPAAINGVDGKMMFDTGTGDALALNDHLLTQLGPGKALGKAKVGSGQGYTMTLRDCIQRVKIGEQNVVEAPAVESEDLGFIEKDITPDFLGFIGYGAYPGYAFKLDYVLRRLTLMKSVKGFKTKLLEPARRSLRPCRSRRAGDRMIRLLRSKSLVVLSLQRSTQDRSEYWKWMMTNVTP